MSFIFFDTLCQYPSHNNDSILHHLPKQLTFMYINKQITEIWDILEKNKNNDKGLEYCW